MNCILTVVVKHTIVSMDDLPVYLFILFFHFFFFFLLLYCAALGTTCNKVWKNQKHYEIVISFWQRDPKPPLIHRHTHTHARMYTAGPKKKSSSVRVRTACSTMVCASFSLKSIKIFYFFFPILQYLTHFINVKPHIFQVNDFK